MKISCSWIHWAEGARISIGLTLALEECQGTTQWSGVSSQGSPVALPSSGNCPDPYSQLLNFSPLLKPYGLFYSRHISLGKLRDSEIGWMSSKSYVHLRTCSIPEPTECCSPKHVTCRGWARRKRWLDCSKQTIFSCEEKSLFNSWAGPIVELFSYEDNLFSRDTYFQAFALISLPKHNIFFLSFSPSRGATSIVYRCKQKGTQKPYALKVLKKTVSLFHYIIASLRELWPEEARSPDSKDKGTRELLHAANSFEFWLWKCSKVGCVLMETVRLWKQLGLQWNVAVGRSVARKNI